MTRAVNQCEPALAGDRAAQYRAFPTIMPEANDDGRGELRFGAVDPRIRGGVRRDRPRRWPQAARLRPGYEDHDRRRRRSCRAHRRTARAAASWSVRSPKPCSSDCSRSMFAARAQSFGRGTRLPTRRWRSAATGTTRCCSMTVAGRGRVGDVVGRGLPAATTMGQLRAALAVTAMQAKPTRPTPSGSSTTTRSASRARSAPRSRSR